MLPLVPPTQIPRRFQKVDPPILDSGTPMVQTTEPLGWIQKGCMAAGSYPNVEQPGEEARAAAVERRLVEHRPAAVTLNLCSPTTKE